MPPEGGPQKAGVLAADRIKAVISRRDVRMAYAALVLVSLAHDLETYCTQTLQSYATSSFGRHSLLSTATVISRVLTVVSYPLFSKLADSTSRMGWYVFVIPVVLSIITNAMYAGSRSIGVYVGASVFNGLSSTGWNMLVQINIAETTSITSRALYSVLADSIASLIAMYTGAEIGGRILNDFGKAQGWRVGYWIWCIIEVACAAPFIAILARWAWRATSKTRQKDTEASNDPVKKSLEQPGTALSTKVAKLARVIWFDFDILGTCLFATGVALVLVPLTLAKGVASQWVGSNLAMVITGFALLILFGLWDCLPDHRRPRWLSKPTQPLIPFHLLRTRTVLALCVVHLCDFLAYAVIQAYFTAFMQVAVGVKAARATQIDNTIRIVFNAWAVVVGLSMRYWQNLPTKHLGGLRAIWFIVPGVLLCVVALAMDIDFVRHPHRDNAIVGLVMAKVLWGIGRACYQTTAQVAVQAAAKRGEMAIATSIFIMTSSIGGMIGTAVSGALWLNLVPDKLQAKLPQAAKKDAQKIYASIVTALKYPQESAERAAIDESYAETLQVMAIVSFCLMIVALLASCCIDWRLTIETRLHRDQAGVSTLSKTDTNGHITTVRYEQDDDAIVEDREGTGNSHTGASTRHGRKSTESGDDSGGDEDTKVDACTPSDEFALPTVGKGST